MLLIAYVNLPYTAVFEYETDETQLNGEEYSKAFSANTASLLHPEPEEVDPAADLPFDVDSSATNTRATGSVSRSKPSKPANSSDADTQPVDMPHGPSMAGEARSATLKNNRASIQPVEWNPRREVEALKKRSAATSFLKSLAKVSFEDDDVKLERARLEIMNNRSPFSDSGSALSNLKAPSYCQHKRRNSSSSFLSLDEPSPELVTIPFSIQSSTTANPGLFNALNSAESQEITAGYKSVGLLGTDTDDLPDATKTAVTETLKSYDCFPAYVPDSVKQGHYDGYCKQFLWPTFHCQIPDVPSSKAYEEHSWDDYVKVNQAIADKLVEVYQKGDVIWIHDYHLMLVPKMVREQLPHAPIGFFMHVAFPSSEVFRCLAYRAELLSGILAANSIGFHVPEYAQHFKMCIARLLAVDITGPGVIEDAEHDAFITTAPIGIDTDRLDRILNVKNPNSEVQQHRRVIRARWPFQKIIAARDKLDSIRGLKQKLRAFDLFLSQNPQWASKVVLVQICTTSRDEAEESALETLADQINSKYGDLASGVQPVVLMTQSIKYEQFLALLSEADGFCVTCIRDGMNLTCHEYAYCSAADRMGPLILSEFTGSASVLGNEAILINPWDREQMAEAFRSCVEMPRWEKEARWNGLKQTVINQPALLWVEELTQHIQEAWEDEESRECVKPDLERLEKLYDSIKDDEKRIFLLELEQPISMHGQDVLSQEQGSKAVRAYEAHKSQPNMSDNINENHRYYYTSRIPLDVRKLCNDPQNIVYIISAESQVNMDWMYRAVSNVGLIAEFGKYVRKRGTTEWTELPLEDDNHWKQKMRPWLKLLEDRSLTSEITVHDTSIIVVFNEKAVSNGDQRDYTVLGEYIALINDHYARELGIRTKLERNVLTLYRSSLGIQRKNAFEMVMKKIKSKVGLTVVANQPFATDADDVIYEWAENLKSDNRTRELVTIVVGKHQSHAQVMVEGTNALLNLLHSMRTKERDIRPR